MIERVVDEVAPGHIPVAQEGPGSTLAAPPRWVFHTVLVVGAGLLCWAVSTPGFSLVPAMAAVALLLPAGILWAVQLSVCWSRHRAWSGWFAVAPSIVVLLVVLLCARVPLEVRWRMSRDAFDAVVGALPQAASNGAEWSVVSVPERIGTYEIILAYRVPDGGVIFYDVDGSLADDAGFAFLPGGPTPSLENGSFESPVFRHLGGSWYSWTASW
jgi:hypothetical protein